MKNFEEFYNKNYKKMLLIPLIITFLAVIYITFFYFQNGDLFYKDVSLTGGTTISIFSDANVKELEKEILKEISNVDIRTISDNSGKQIQIIVTIQEKDSEKAIEVIEKFLGFKLDDKNSTIETTSSVLGKSFHAQLITAIALAFFWMSAVVFLIFGNGRVLKTSIILLNLVLGIFLGKYSSMIISKPLLLISFLILLIPWFLFFKVRKDKIDKIFSSIILILSFILFIFSFFNLIEKGFILIFILLISLFLLTIYIRYSIPSFAVLFAAFSDVVFALAIANLFGIKLSTAGIVAFLMLIGYSVDSDILLTTRVLKRKGSSINAELFSAFKTALTMSLTSIVAIGIALIFVYRFGTVLNQIFTILLIGLSFDIISTWFGNASIIKWFLEKNEAHN